MMNFRRLLLISLAAVAGVNAQGPASPRFEVASVRPAAPGGSGTQINNGPARFEARNITLFGLILFGYAVRDFQVTNAPDWVRDARYDITATYDPATEDVSLPDEKSRLAFAERMRARVRHLMADRFQLTMQEVKKDLPVYALVVDRGGHKLKVATEPRGGMNTHANNGTGQIRGDGVTLRRLSESLSGLLSQPVLDETGLNGLFSFELKWSIDSAGDGGPTVFTAVREQLGLRLESKRAPVVSYVFERAQRPGEN